MGKRRLALRPDGTPHPAHALPCLALPGLFGVDPYDDDQPPTELPSRLSQLFSFCVLRLWLDVAGARAWPVPAFGYPMIDT